MKRIRAQHELVELAAELGVRSDWHEPDDRGVTARVESSNFNNAGFWPAENRPFSAPEIIELHVIISRNDEDVAAVNLATLLAWASAPVAVPRVVEAKARRTIALEIESVARGLETTGENRLLGAVLGAVVRDIADKIRTGERRAS